MPYLLFTFVISSTISICNPCLPRSSTFVFVSQAPMVSSYKITGETRPRRARLSKSHTEYPTVTNSPFFSCTFVSRSWLAGSSVKHGFSGLIRFVIAHSCTRYRCVYKGRLYTLKACNRTRATNLLNWPCIIFNGFKVTEDVT